MWQKSFNDELTKLAFLDRAKRFGHLLLGGGKKDILRKYHDSKWDASVAEREISRLQDELREAGDQVWYAKHRNPDLRLSELDAYGRPQLKSHVEEMSDPDKVRVLAARQRLLDAKKERGKVRSAINTATYEQARHQILAADAAELHRQRSNEVTRARLKAGAGAGAVGAAALTAYGVNKKKINT